MKVAALLLILVVTAPLFAHAASAVLAASNFGGQYTTGTVRIDVDAHSGLFAATTAVMPGDAITSPITVTNEGTLEFRYAVTLTNRSVEAGMRLTIWDEAAEQDVDNSCQSTAPASVLYGPAAFGNSTQSGVIGSPAQGSQAGDRVLAPRASETLCFQLRMPATLASTMTGPSFNFPAEQTHNNP